MIKLLCGVLCVFVHYGRNPFMYQTATQTATQDTALLASASFPESARAVYFSRKPDNNLQITLQEKSPSTLEKAEGLGG